MEAINRSNLKHLFLQNADDDERQERNTQLMENAQELPKVKIRQCLVPRKEIIGVDSRISIESVKKKFECYSCPIFSAPNQANEVNRDKC